MSSHPFPPFRRNPSAPLYPKRVLDQLHKPKLPKLPPYEIQPGRYLIPFIDTSGFSLEEICQRMQLPHGKTAITKLLAVNHGLEMATPLSGRSPGIGVSDGFGATA